MSEILSRDEVEYVRCALNFQIEHDDGSNPPPLEAGESASEKFHSLNAGEDRQIVVFSWNKDMGECYDCGLPAAYALVVPVQYRDDPEHRRCCVCAAQAASSGESIRWLYEEAYS